MFESIQHIDEIHHRGFLDDKLHLNSLKLKMTYKQPVGRDKEEYVDNLNFKHDLCGIGEDCIKHLKMYFPFFFVS